MYSILRRLPFFKTFHQKVLRGTTDIKALYKMCRFVRYLQKPACSVICREGDKSNNLFYIILTGGVVVVLKDNKNVYHKEE